MVKKNPLKLPPNFDELPMTTPENQKIKNQNNGEIKSLLNIKEKNYKQSDNTDGLPNKSLQELLLDKIKNN